MRIQVCLNGKPSTCRGLDLDPTWSIDDFLYRASARLHLKGVAIVAYDSNGRRLDDPGCLTSGEVISISEDGKAYMPGCLTKETRAVAIAAAARVAAAATITSDDTIANPYGSPLKQNASMTPILRRLGNYLLDACVGKGGFGEVFRATHGKSGNKGS